MRIKKAEQVMQMFPDLEPEVCAYIAGDYSSVEDLRASLAQRMNDYKENLPASSSNKGEDVSSLGHESDVKAIESGCEECHLDERDETKSSDIPNQDTNSDT
jgi:hypothetical protein